MNPPLPPLRKFQCSVILYTALKGNVLLKSPSLSEFPLTFLGVGMDIFWNSTLEIATR